MPCNMKEAKLIFNHMKQAADIMQCYQPSLESLGSLSFSPLTAIPFNGSLLLFKHNLEGALEAPADLDLVRLVEKWLSVKALTLSCQLCSEQGGGTNLTEDIFDVQSNTEPSPQNSSSSSSASVFGPMWLYH